jgi:hypothetical protein
MRELKRVQSKAKFDVSQKRLKDKAKNSFSIKAKNAAFNVSRLIEAPIEKSNNVSKVLSHQPQAKSKLTKLKKEILQERRSIFFSSHQDIFLIYENEKHEMDKMQAILEETFQTSKRILKASAIDYMEKK